MTRHKYVSTAGAMTGKPGSLGRRTGSPTATNPSRSHTCSLPVRRGIEAAGQLCAYISVSVSVSVAVSVSVCVALSVSLSRSLSLSLSLALSYILRRVFAVASITSTVREQHPRSHHTSGGKIGFELATDAIHTHKSFVGQAMRWNGTDE